MPNVKISGFTGIAPRIGPSQLQSNQAQIARNVKLQSGEIRPWRKPVFTFQPVTPQVATIYKYLGPSGFSWLEWATDVDVVSSPIADTSDFRIYYTGDGTPKKTNYSLATTGTGAKPVAHLEMGVPFPTVAPTLSATGGTAPTEDRAYIYTYISTFGLVKEESAPSPATIVTCNAAGATVTISGFGTAPTTGYNITAVRIYRVVSGATTATYFQVGEVPINPATGVATGSFSDTKTVAQLGAALPSLNWTPPPTDLKGLVSMPNGMLAAFTGNQVWFCEQYYPHAWPVQYMLTTEFPVVGLGVYGNTLFVGTTKNPYLITGTSPAAMSQEKLSMVQACVAKRSIVFDQFGIVYASPDGLVAVGPGVQDIITSTLYTRDDWQKLNPSSIIASLYRNSYMGFYTGTTGTQGGIVMARNDSPPLTNFDFPATALFIERNTGNIFGVSSLDNAIYQLDADPNNNTLYDWKSKRFLLSNPVNFAALKVDGDFAYLQDVTTANAHIAELNLENATIFNNTSGSLGGCFNDAPFNTYLVDGGQLFPVVPSLYDLRNIQVLVYADGIQVFSTSITNNDPVRMPAGFKAYVWEIEFTGNTPVRDIAMATSILELKSEQQVAMAEYREA